MRYFWIALFAAVPILSVALFFWAPSAGGAYWLPESITSAGDAGLSSLRL